MRRVFHTVVLATALASTPALAQLVGGRVGAGVGVNVDTGRTVDGVHRTLDRTVDTVDRNVNEAMRSDVRVATRADVRSGATVRDSRGRRVGTVQAIHGDTALVVQGNRSLHVPLSSLYRGTTGLVTSLSRAQLRASADTQAQARAGRRD